VSQDETGDPSLRRHRLARAAIESVASTRQPPPRRSIRHGAASRVSAKGRPFTESVIRAMTRLWTTGHDAVNRARASPTFMPGGDEGRGAKAAIDARRQTQYAISPGAREGVPVRPSRRRSPRLYPGGTVDPMTKVCVTCGSDRAMIATRFGCRPRRRSCGSSKPFDEKYGPDAIMSGRGYPACHAEPARLVDRRGEMRGRVSRDRTPLRSS